MRHLPAILLILVPTIIVAVAIFQPFVDPRLLMLDPMVAAEESGLCCKTYYGLISTLGVIGWFSTAAICAFAAVALFALRGAGKAILFCSVAAILTGVLGVDDAFLFHENIAPKLGIEQNVVLGFYAIVAGLFVLSASQILKKDNLVLFVIAGGFLAFSMGLDVVWHSTDSMVVSIEDGAKFIGIWCWFGAHFGSLIELLKRTTDQSNQKAPAHRLSKFMGITEKQAVTA